MPDTDTLHVPMRYFGLRWDSASHDSARPGAGGIIRGLRRPARPRARRLLVWDAFVRSRSRVLLLGIALLLVVLIGLLDLASGTEFSIAILYLVPVALATWRLGVWPGIAVAAAGALIGGLADAGMPALHWTIPCWNSLARLGTFGIFAGLLARLQAALDLLHARSFVDGATGTTPADLFWKIAEVERERAGRCKHAFTLALLDLAGLGEVNGRNGRTAGDDLLRAVVGHLREELRGGELMSRLGGARIGILFPEAGRLRAGAIFPRWRDDLTEMMRERQWPVSLRFGVATFLEPPASFDAMLRSVESLMDPAHEPGNPLRMALVRPPPVP